MSCSCRKVALALILLILSVLQVSYLTLKLLRIFFLPPIARDSNDSTTYNYEFGVYGIVIFLQIFEYSVLFYSLGQSTLHIGKSCCFLRPLKSGQCARPYQRLWTIVLLGILFLLAIAIAIFAFIRDLQYIDRSAGQLGLTIVYEFTKLGVYSANAMIRVFVTALYWQYVSEWDQRRTGIKDVEVMNEPIKVKPEGITEARHGDAIERPPCTVVRAVHVQHQFGTAVRRGGAHQRLSDTVVRYYGALDLNSQRQNSGAADLQERTVARNGGAADLLIDIDVQARINTYAYNMHYHDSGRRTAGIREALQSWFVMQYLVYILGIFTDVVSVAKPIFRGDSHQQKWEIWAHSASIIYAVVSILLPYLLALWMIDTHRRYYAEMNRKHLLTDSRAPTISAEVTPDAEVTESRAPTPDTEVSRAPTPDTEVSRAPTPDTEVRESRGPTPNEEVTESRAPTPNTEVTDRRAPTPYAEMSKKLLLTDSGAPTQTAKHCYIAEVNARKIKPCQEYDFCPQILGVTVPVTSPGYAVSIFLALFTLVAKFIT